MRGRAACGDVGVLDRVQVDRAAVRVLRPARRAVDVAAVEGRRVVRLDRAEVRAAVRVDREPSAGSGSAPRRGAAAPSTTSGSATSRCDDDPAGVHAPVEAPVTRRDEPELVEPERASAVPRDVPPSGANVGAGEPRGGEAGREQPIGAGPTESGDDEDTRRGPPASTTGVSSGDRGGRIRTDDLPLPKRALYQAELHPVAARSATRCMRPGARCALRCRRRGGRSSLTGYTPRRGDRDRPPRARPVRRRRTRGSATRWSTAAATLFAVNGTVSKVILTSARSRACG